MEMSEGAKEHLMQTRNAYQDRTKTDFVPSLPRLLVDLDSHSQEAQPPTPSTAPCHPSRHLA